MGKKLMNQFVEENLSTEVVLGQEQNKDIMSKQFGIVMGKLKNFYSELMNE